MPENSDQRCVGIATVMEALLDGLLEDDSRAQTADAIAATIYQGLRTGGQIRYPRYLRIGGKHSAIESKEALETLSTLVANRYKDDYFRASDTDEGQQRLFAAEESVVKTRRELDALLAADSDHVDAFFGVGTRWFPDGSIKSTHHAVLLSAGKGGKIFVYDPNEPAKPLDCRLEQTEGGLTIEWTCRYRETGLVTTQRYQVIHKDAYYKLAFK
jgi:hypothetical protein